MVIFLLNFYFIDVVKIVVGYYADKFHLLRKDLIYSLFFISDLRRFINQNYVVLKQFSKIFY